MLFKYFNLFRVVLVLCKLLNFELAVFFFFVVVVAIIIIIDAVVDVVIFVVVVALRPYANVKSFLTEWQT